MSLAELCKSTAKKAKEKEKTDIKSTLGLEIKGSSEEEVKAKPRIGPHTPPLPREPSSPRLTPEPSSTADFSKSYFQDELDERYKRHYHHHRHQSKHYVSTSRSPSPIDSYRNHGESRSYSVGSTRSYGKSTSIATSTTLSSCKRRQYRESSVDKERFQPVSGTRTVSPPSLSSLRAVEKKPYFVDKRRERDRLRQKYGEEYADAIMSKRTRTPDKYSDAKREKRRLYSHDYGQRSLSRSKSPISRGSVRTHSSGHEMQHSERYRRLSPMSERHILRLRRGFSRSRSRERRLAIAQPPTQIITIPVAVPPDFPYAFTSWPPQCSSAFPLNSLLRPSAMQTIRSHYGMAPYNPNMFRPQQRYPHMNIYGPRPMRRLPFPPNRNP